MPVTAVALADGVPLDDEDREHIELSALLYARLRKSPKEAIEHFALCMEKLALLISSTADAGDDVDFGADDYLPADVLSRWEDSRQFVDKDGSPMPLPAKSRGGPSFDTLVRSVDSRADSDKLLKYLLRIGAVERVGKRYMLKDRKARHQPTGRLLPKFNFKASLALLRTVESNIRPGSPRQYQFTTDGRIPKDSVEEFREESAAVGEVALRTWDEAIQSKQTDATQDKRSWVKMTGGVYMNEDRPLPSLLLASKNRR
jgi:hypothetical protein